MAPLRKAQKRSSPLIEVSLESSEADARVSVRGGAEGPEVQSGLVRVGIGAGGCGGVFDEAACTRGNVAYCLGVEGRSWELQSDAL